MFSTVATIVLISISTLTFSCTRHAGKITQMPPMEAMGMLRNDFATLIDVRENDQQKNGFAQGALLMSSSKMDTNSPEWKEFMSRFPKDKRMIVYGATPAETAKAAELLAANGFDVGNIGTYDDWVKAGLPTQKR